jgi:hypothetical protein
MNDRKLWMWYEPYYCMFYGTSIFQFETEFK